MRKTIGLSTLLFVLLTGSSSAQETCSPIQPDGSACVQTTENRETQPGVWEWNFHNHCGSSLQMNFRRGDGTTESDFDIPAHADSPWYCSNNCGGIVHHEARCYGGSSHATESTPRRLSSTPPPNASPPASTASPTPPPVSSTPVAPPVSPPRNYSKLACSQSGADCRSACLQTFGMKGAADADAMVVCYQSCTSQLNACTESGNALANSTLAITAGKAGAVNPGSGNKKSGLGTTHLGTPGNRKASSEGPRSVGAVNKHTGYVLGHDPNTCGRRYGAPYWLCAPNCSADQRRRSQLAIACTQRE
jgi:hypothetical protein